MERRDRLLVSPKQIRSLAFRHFMNGEASFEHIIHIQVVECFFFMDLPQHAADDAVVLYPENFHPGAGNRSIQTLTQVSNDLVALVYDFEPDLGASWRQFEDAA